MILSNNPAYTLAIEHEGNKIFLPVNIMEGYHQRRYAEAINQNIYASAGATPEVINLIADEVILRCNKATDSETRMTDIAALMQSLKYRTKFPVDQHCLIRIGAILSFMEYEHEGRTITEHPDFIEALWINKKVELALTVPSMYAFFLNLGQINSPSYEAHLHTLNDLDYFQRRMEALKGIIPESLHHLTKLYSLG